MKSSYNITNCDVSFIFQLEELFVLIDVAVPLGLIINELVSNSFKHVFPGREKGEISIKLKTGKYSTLKIEISDNGTDSGFRFFLEFRNDAFDTRV